MATFKFIHTADLHIDSPMKGLRLVDVEMSERARVATRAAFKKLVDFALEENVSFIVVAGDIFDGDWDDASTGKWTSDQFKRLDERDIPVYIALGNHDLKNKIVKRLAFPKNVKIFSSDSPERFIFPENAPKDSSKRVVLTGQSYENEKCPRDLARDYPPRDRDAFNIGVLHTSLGGLNADNYSPTDVDALVSKGYDYWALGHVHQGRVLREKNPWIGFSGVLQARHINESGSKGCYLVEVVDGVLSNARFVELDVLRWVRLEIDCDLLRDGERTDDENGFDSLYKERLSEALERAQGRMIAVRVHIFGRTTYCRELRRLFESGLLRDRLDSLFNDSKVWLEEIRLDAKPLRSNESFKVGVLKRIADDFAKKDELFDQALAEGRDMRSPQLAAEAKLFEDRRKKLGEIESDLRGENGTDGIDFDDPALFKRWNQKALEILRDLFSDEED